MDYYLAHVPLFLCLTLLTCDASMLAFSSYDEDAEQQRQDASSNHAIATVMNSLERLVQTDRDVLQEESALEQLLRGSTNQLMEISATRHEDVCRSRLDRVRAPFLGHLPNGSTVEVELIDGPSTLVLVACGNARERRPCHGVDKNAYWSECVTVFDHKLAHVRSTAVAAGTSGSSSSPWSVAWVRLPIACQCRVRSLLQLPRRR